MIYTITFNPALDYIVKMDEFNLGNVNRSNNEFIYAGGKGINVSIILKTLGIDSTALGFIAGFVGEEIERQVKKYGIKTDFIKLENDNSRINVKITTTSNEVAINAKGPFIDQSYIQLLYKKIEFIENGDTLILSGSIPEGISNDIYQNICEKIGEKDVKIDVNIIVEYGSRIPDVAFEIQNREKKSVESMTGLKVSEVNVHVQGVKTEKDEEDDKETEKEDKE